MINQEQILEAQLEKLREENKLIRQIATSSGFYQFYFSKLKDFKTNIACFNHANELYFKYFDEYKYASYESFRKLKNKYLRQ